MSELLTIPRVAEILQVCDNTVRAMIRDGELRAVKVRAQWRVRECDIEAYLDAQLTAA